MRCAAYLRFSSDMQRKESIVDQERQCRKAAASKGWKLLNNYVRSDEAKSGTSLVGRDGLITLINDAKKRPRPFDLVLVDDTSRLARNIVDVLEIVDTFARYQVHVYFVGQNLDSREGERFRMMLTFYGMFDEQYISRLAKNVWRGQEGRVLEGYSSGSRCFGYRSVKPVAGDSDNDRRSSKGTKLEVIGAEADTIRRICEMFANGTSVHQIVTRFNAEKVPAARKPRIGTRDTSWNHNLVNRILRNERYIGIVVWNRQKQYKDRRTGQIEIRPKPQNEILRVPTPHLRIVSDELWSRVQDRLKVVNEQVKAHRLGGLNRAKSKTYLFSGLLKCGICRESIVITGGKGEEASYGCRANRYARGCTNNLRVRQDRFAAQLIRALAANLFSPDILEYLIINVCKELNQTLQGVRKLALAESSDELAQKKTAIETRMSKILDAIEVMDSAHAVPLTDRFVAAQAELATLNQQINARRTEAKTKVSVEETRRLVTDKLKELFNVCQADISKARQMMQQLIKTLVLVPVDSPDGPIYEVIGDVDLFAPGAAISPDVMLGDSSTRTFQHYESFRHGFAGIQIDPRLEEPGEKTSINSCILHDLLRIVLEDRPDLQGKKFGAREWEAHLVAVTGSHKPEEKRLFAPKYMAWLLMTYKDRFSHFLNMDFGIDPHTGSKKYSFSLLPVRERAPVDLPPITPNHPNHYLDGRIVTPP